MAALSRPARQDNPHLAMGLAQGLAVHRDMEIRSISIRLPVLHLQASSISQTLALPLRRTVTHTLREAVDQQTRQQLTCLHPGTQLIMPRAMPCTLLMLRTTYWCDGASLTPCANGRITKPCIVRSVT
jgi:hypothetical protein